jgi:hypothetical protein
MSIFGGSTEVSEIYSGSTEVKDVYSGSDLVWSNVPNINFAPSSWNGSTGVWNQETTGAISFPPSAAGFKTTYIGVGKSLWNSGSFFTTGIRFNTNTLAVQPSTQYRLSVVQSGSTQDYMGQGTGGVYLTASVFAVGGGSISGKAYEQTWPSAIITQEPLNYVVTPNGTYSLVFTTSADMTQCFIRLDSSFSRNQSGQAVIFLSDVYLEKA